jgi:hypothetical protein
MFGNNRTSTKRIFFLIRQRRSDLSESGQSLCGKLDDRWIGGWRQADIAEKVAEPGNPETKLNKSDFFQLTQCFRYSELSTERSLALRFSKVS